MSNEELRGSGGTRPSSGSVGLARKARSREQLRLEKAELDGVRSCVPGQWTKLKIEAQGMIAKVYVNRAEQPTLIVNDLKQPSSSGGIALWVGQGTIAHFADLAVTP